MHHSRSKVLTTIAVILLVLAAFLAGFRWHTNGASRPVYAAAIPAQQEALQGTLDDSVTVRPVELYSEALQHLQQEYVGTIDHPEDLTYNAIRGMLATLKDPYTRYMDPKEFADFTSENEGHFAGIGASLINVEVPSVKPAEGQGVMAPVICPCCGAVISDVKYYRVAVAEPLPDTPAAKAGLQPGDFILKVDDTSTTGLLVGDVVDKIRGEAGTKVRLTIARKGTDKPFEVTLTRAQIEVPAVEAKILDNNIGYMHLLSFNEKTAAETRQALNKFKAAHVRGVVLDLRNNPGGLMSESIRIASWLLPSDEKLIVSTKGRDGIDEPYNRTDSPLFTAPLVVLVNKNSASASEILTGALKDYKRAEVVGESTFGKALVQSVIRLSDGSAMAITTAHYYTPGGHDIAKKGVAPDIAIELDKDVKTVSDNDNQAQKAISILKDEMAKAQ